MVLKVKLFIQNVIIKAQLWQLSRLFRTKWLVGLPLKVGKKIMDNLFQIMRLSYFLLKKRLNYLYCQHRQIMLYIMIKDLGQLLVKDMTLELLQILTKIRKVYRIQVIHINCQKVLMFFHLKLWIILLEIIISKPLTSKFTPLNDKLIVPWSDIRKNQLLLLIL